MTHKLSALNAEDVAADVALAIYETLCAGRGALAPLLHVDIRGPFHDLPAGVDLKLALRRSFVYGTDLGLAIRDLVLYAQVGRGLDPDEAIAKLTFVNRTMGTDQGPAREERSSPFTSPMQVVAYATVGRVLLETGGDLPAGSLAALADLEPADVRALVAAGEIPVTDSGAFSNDGARTWLAARGVRGTR